MKWGVLQKLFTVQLNVMVIANIATGGMSHRKVRYQMQIVINIPEEIYKASQIIDVKYEDVVQIPLEVIANGTPLQDLYDLEGLKSDMKALNCGYPYGLDYLLDCLDKRLGITIIESDTESEDKK